MLSIDTARALAAVGVVWEPQAGDRFAIESVNLRDEVFWISDLTIELHHYHDQAVLGFNGTTEWALDSVSLDQARWLPREDQLRELIGDRLVSLTRTPDGWDVVIDNAGARTRHTHHDAEEAYAAALLAITHAAVDVGR